MRSERLCRNVIARIANQPLTEGSIFVYATSNDELVNSYTRFWPPARRMRRASRDLCGPYLLLSAKFGHGGGIAGPRKPEPFLWQYTRDYLSSTLFSRYSQFPIPLDPASLFSAPGLVAANWLHRRVRLNKLSGAVRCRTCM
jgi:hypothetical protein